MQLSEAVSQYISKQEKYQNEMFYIRKMIFEQLSNVEESLKWKIPFYSYKTKPLLYLNPTKKKLIIGLMDGRYLEDEENLFAQKSLSLKRIRHVYFPVIPKENFEYLSDKQIELYNQENKIFEQKFCKILKKATFFIDNKV